MYRTLLVALGGLVGSVARYWISGSVQNWSPSVFPVGTLVVNVLGSFILGLVMVLSVDRSLLDPEIRILVGTGFCGGFTTMSTFSYETFALIQYGSAAAAAANIAASLISCLTAVWLGTVAGRLL